MSAEIITRAQLVEYASRSGVSGVSDADWDDAIAQTVDAIRQAALNEYTSASFESLTAVTAPDSMRTNALSLALAIATKGDAGRPTPIDTANAEASKWLGLIVAGRTHYDQSPGAVLVKLSTIGEVSSQTQPLKLHDPWCVTR